MLPSTAVGGSGGLFGWRCVPYEIKHMNFFVSAAIGIPGGVLVMLLGVGIGVASKSPRLGQHFD
jgi:hypothetical protein